jgi:hypothetical protein
MDLAPSSERLPSYRTDPRRSASHGIGPRVCPAFGIPVVRPPPSIVGLSHHCRSARVLPRTRTRSAPVVSHHLDGLLRTQASGLLHPEAERGSLRFAMPPPRPLAEATVRGLVHPSPQRGSHPSKNSPRRQPYHVPVAVALLPLPPTTRHPARRSIRSSALPCQWSLSKCRAPPKWCLPHRVAPRSALRSVAEAWRSARSVPPLRECAHRRVPPSLTGRVGPTDRCPEEHWTVFSRADRGRPEPPRRARKRASREPAAACPHECGSDQDQPLLAQIPSRGFALEAARHFPTCADL